MATQIDHDCEPLVNRGRFGVLSSDNDNEELVVSVCRAPLHAMERGIAVPVSEGCPHVPKRLRLTRNQRLPVGVLEHDLIHSEPDVPPPMCPSSVGPIQSEVALEQLSRAEVHDLPAGLCSPRMWTITIHHNQVCSRIFSTRLQAKWRQSDQHCTIPATSRTPKQ